MNIALIHHQYMPRGGIETQLINYAHGLNDQGHNITIIASKVGPAATVPAGAQVLKADVSRIPKPMRKFFFNRRVGRLMEQHTFDLSIALGRTCYQDVMVCGGTHKGFLVAMNKSGRRPSDRLDLYLEEQAYRQSKVNFAVSDMIRRELIEHYQLQPEKVEILYPPVNAPQFKFRLQANREEWRAKYQIDPAKKTFLFVSTGHKRKGIELMREVFRHLPPNRYELIVVGSATPPTDNIRYLGFSDCVEELYVACDFSVLPSFYEPFGLVVCESIQCGTPVIISDWVGAAEIVNPNEGRVVHGFDAESWRHTFEQISVDDFNIAPDFAERNALTVSAHVQELVHRSQQHLNRPT